MSTMLWQHKNVRYPGERRVVSHNSRESYLISAFVNAKGKRVFDRSGDGFARAARRPVRIVRQEVMNQINVKTRSFGADFVITMLPGFRHWFRCVRSPRVSKGYNRDCSPPLRSGF